MNYYENCEEIGNQLFLKWAKEVKCFTELTRQDLYSRVDWIGKTIKGHLINCELKVRNTLDYPTIFIEIGKYNYLLQKWNNEKIIPFYINLCGDTVLVFDLRKVKPIKRTTVRIWSKPDKCYKWVERYELPTDKSCKFINGIQIKRNINN